MKRIFMNVTRFKSDSDTTAPVARCVVGGTSLVLVITRFTGWVLNVIALIQLLDGDLTAMFIVRLIGVVVPPLGSILGLFF